jgi:hypothetical protein
MHPQHFLTRIPPAAHPFTRHRWRAFIACPSIPQLALDAELLRLQGSLEVILASSI